MSSPRLFTVAWAFLLVSVPLAAQVEPPPAPKATFRIAAGSAFPGGEVTLPFSVRGNHELGAFSFSVDFDEEALEATGIEKLYDRPDGRPWGFEVLYFNNANDSPGNGGVDEGYLAGGVAFCLRLCDARPPPDQENEILAFRFRVRTDAPPGPTELRFLDGAVTPASQPVPNVASLSGDSAALTLIHGRVDILAPSGKFLRGDSNGDLKVDLSDAIATLSHLFRGTRALGCPDAADANDDGRVDIADAIFTFRLLFRGGRSLPPPTGAPAEDPSPDGLGDCLDR